LAKQQLSKTAACVLRVAGATCQATHECYVHDETKSSHKYKQCRLTPFEPEGALLKPEVAGILADLCHLTGGKGISSGQTKARVSIHVLHCRQKVWHDGVKCTFHIKHITCGKTMTPGSVLHNQSIMAKRETKDLQRSVPRA
jgi:hypothetical protein